MCSVPVFWLPYADLFRIHKIWILFTLVRTDLRAGNSKFLNWLLIRETFIYNVLLIRISYDFFLNTTRTYSYFFFTKNQYFLFQNILGKSRKVARHLKNLETRNEAFLCSFFEIFINWDYLSQNILKSKTSFFRMYCCARKR